MTVGSCSPAGDLLCAARSARLNAEVDDGTVVIPSTGFSLSPIMCCMTLKALMISRVDVWVLDSRGPVKTCYSRDAMIRTPKILL